MFCIISGTDRKGSRSLEISKIAKKFYDTHFDNVEIIDLYDVPLQELTGDHYGDNKPQAIVDYVEKVTKAEGLLVVCPEYNGSMPGALKYFIDHWKYPETFDNKKVAFIGLGGAFAGLRPVEHLQQIFGYRSADIYPKRVFLANVWNILKEGQLDEKHTKRIEEQAAGFADFIARLKD